MTESIRNKAAQVAIVLAFTILMTGTARGAFTTHQLVLRQGSVPTLNGVPIQGAPVYTGAADTYVFKDTPDTNYATADTLRFFNSEVDGSPGQHATRAYVRFDDFTNYLPAGSTIIDSQLRVTAAGREGAGEPLDVSYRTAAWDESTLTFNTAGSWSQNIKNMGGANRNDGFLSGSKYNVDISAVSRAWASESVANNGLQFSAREAYGATYPDYQMYSSDHATEDNRPTLIIDYVAPERVQAGMLARERSVEILQGTSVFEDTVVEQSTTNFATATTTGVLQTRNSAAPPRPRRGLIKVLADHPDIAALAATGAPVTEGTTQLVSARIEFNIVNSSYRGKLRLATAAQDWEDTAATGSGGVSGNGFATATTEWAEAWDYTTLTNYDTDLGSFNYDPAFQAGTQSFDITSILQGYIDGGDNFGFIMEGGLDYGSHWALTGYNFTHMQPTLVLETVTFVVPEPASFLMIGLGATLLLGRRRR